MAKQPMHRGGNVLWMGDLEAYMDGEFIGEAFRLMGEAVNCIKVSPTHTISNYLL